MNFKPKELYEALRQNRRRENAEEFKDEYRNRAGIEGTISQGVRAFGLRRSRCMGISKTRLQHLATAAAINLERVSVRICRSYRRFYTRIRRATDARAIGELMKQACEARQNGEISVKHFIALNTAAENQRERLLSAPLSATAYKLIDEIVVVS